MTPLFRPIAEHALMVEFRGKDPQTKVLALDAALAAQPFAGFAESVPATTTLMVEFDPAATCHAQAKAALRALLDRPAPPLLPRDHLVKVCYDAPFAPDLEAVAKRCGLTPEGVIEAHLHGQYRVAMYGFAPGYAYLSGVPKALHLPRKPAAKRDVPAGSVLIAGGQGLVSTMTMPTGWWIIGRSPTAILTGDPARPFLFDVGDRIRFARIKAGDMG